MDDDTYADIYEPTHKRGEQTASASIEAVVTTLGDSDLASRQDSVSFKKFEETPVGLLNRILGVDISTRRLAVRTPIEYVASTVATLEKLGTPKVLPHPLCRRVADRLPWLHSRNITMASVLDVVHVHSHCTRFKNHPNLPHKKQQ